jgi:hypothetical protein
VYVSPRLAGAGLTACASCAANVPQQQSYAADVHRLSRVARAGELSGARLCDLPAAGTDGHRRHRPRVQITVTDAAQRLLPPVCQEQAATAACALHAARDHGQGARCSQLRADDGGVPAAVCAGRSRGEGPHGRSRGPQGCASDPCCGTALG